MKLTKPIISKLIAGNRDQVVWDSSLSGFGVRVKPSGVKAYVLQYRNRHGSSKRLPLRDAINEGQQGAELGLTKDTNFCCMALIFSLSRTRLSCSALPWPRRCVV